MNVSDYIMQYDDKTQERLNMLRLAINEVSDKLEERMSWQMPTFWYKKNIIHFAAHKNHIGIYPGPEAIAAFKAQLKDYKTSKGSIQIHNDKQLPIALIKELVKYNLNKI